MAEEHDSTGLEHHEPVVGLSNSRRALRATRPTGSSAGSAVATRRTARRSAPRLKPAVLSGMSMVRRLTVFGVCAALVGTAAIPAFAAASSGPEARTVQQLAADDAQSLVVASDEQPADLSRSSYAATTPKEIQKKKDAAAAAKAAAERARQAKLASASFSPVKVDLNMKGPGSGAIRWPLAHINHIGDGFLARGGEHQGVDLLTAGGTPIFAAASGTVRVSSEGYYGYGVAVTIDSNIGGKTVNTLYGHMRYGSRQVAAGQHVQAGQVIGLVGSTGRSTANHLHFEVAINGAKIDPLAWLRANAG